MEVKLSELVIITLLTLSSYECLIAFDCNGETPKTIEVSLVDVNNCRKTTPNITYIERHIQLVQPKIYETVEYKQCLIEIEHFIFRCGKTIDTFHQDGLISELPTISDSECSQMINEGTFKYQGFLVKFDNTVNVNYISATTYGSISDGSCTPGSYAGALIMNGKSYYRAVRLSKFKIKVKKSIATVDVEDKKLILEDGIKCTYTSNHCFSADSGYIYWASYFEDPSCRNVKEYIPIFDGVATEITEYKSETTIKSFVIHYEDYDFQITTINKRSRICNQIVELTEHPKLSILIKDNNLNNGLKIRNKELGKNLNIMTYFNSKLLYILKHTKDQVEAMYSQISFERCLSENKIIHNMMALASISPHQFTYQYFGTPGYTATTVGEVIHLVKCRPVSVNFTRTVKCYNEIPILYKEKLHFIVPRTRIISEIGTERECSLIMKNKFKFNDEWFIVTKEGLLMTTAPEKLKINPDSEWQFMKIPNLAKAGIYSPQDLDQAQKVIMNPIQREAMTSNIQRGIMGESQLPEGQSIMNLISTSDLEHFAKKTFGDLMGTIYFHISKFGNIISFVIGSIVLIRAFKFCLNILVNTTILYRAFGLSWKLLFFWWENITHHLLRNKNVTEKNDIEEGEKNKNQPEKSINSPLLRPKNFIAVN